MGHPQDASECRQIQSRILLGCSAFCTITKSRPSTKVCWLLLQPNPSISISSIARGKHDMLMAVGSSRSADGTPWLPELLAEEDLPTEPYTTEPKPQAGLKKQRYETKSGSFGTSVEETKMNHVSLVSLSLPSRACDLPFYQPTPQPSFMLQVEVVASTRSFRQLAKCRPHAGAFGLPWPGWLCSWGQAPGGTTPQISFFRDSGLRHPQ